MHREEGFSLVEIMMVLVVIALLVTIGLPSFMGARDRAADTAAKEGAAISFGTARVVFTSGSYAGVTPAELELLESSVDFVGASTPSTDAGIASVHVPDAVGAASTFVTAVYSSSGECFYIVDVAGSGTSFGSVFVPSPSECTADGYGAVALGEDW